MHEHLSGHIADLKHLWHTVFGDAPSVIDTYFDMFYSPDLTAAEFTSHSGVSLFRIQNKSSYTAVRVTLPMFLSRSTTSFVLLALLISPLMP